MAHADTRQLQQQMVDLDRKISRFERMLKEVLLRVVKVKPLKMKEADVIKEYDISQSRLKQMRIGYTDKHGTKHPRVLFKWTHVNGRKIEYHVPELEKVLGRKTAYDD